MARTRIATVVLVAVVVAVVAAAVAARVGGSNASGYVVKGLVSSGGIAAPVHDKALVNGWGLAATSTGPWWTTNEASDKSTLYSGDGRKQVLTVSVPGGPTGIAAYVGLRVPCHGRRRLRSGPVHLRV